MLRFEFKENIEPEAVSMRFVADRNSLLRALGHITGIVEKRNTIPILSNILIGAEASGVLTLKATDLDMEAIETIPAKVSTPGAATVPAHTLHDIVRKLPDGAEIDIELKGPEGRLKVTAGRASFELSILPADEFPDMGQAELPHRFTVEGGELKRLFEKSRFAISTEETRYYLNGIYLHRVEGGASPKLRAVATDGHRLAQVETEATSGTEGMPGVIVPRKAVAEIIKLLDDGQAPVEVALSPAKIRFAVGEVVLTSKLIDGSFPDYARVIPAANTKFLDSRKRRSREGRGPRLDALLRKGPRGEARRERRQCGRLRQQSGFGIGNGGNLRGLQARADRDWLQRALSARHRGADRRQQGAVQAGRRLLADADLRRKRPPRALRADADAGLARPCAC